LGGMQATFTDLVLSPGLAVVNVPVRRPALARKVAEGACRAALDIVNRVVERVRPSAGVMPAVCVGCGSVLLPGVLNGNTEAQRPADHAVANAIGAAISEVSDSVDRIVDFGSWDVDSVRHVLRAEVDARAVAACAEAKGVRIVLREETPIAYLPGKALRMRANAGGPLANRR
jgi:hypothetical protein